MNSFLQVCANASASPTHGGPPTWIAGVGGPLLSTPEGGGGGVGVLNMIGGLKWRPKCDSLVQPVTPKQDVGVRR